jgi:tetratricopeptide (TPR) repeat protein
MLNVDEIRQLGNNHFLNKDYETATRLYDRAIRYSPDLAVLYLNKASSCLRSGYVQKAYDAAKIGLEKGGDPEKALYRYLNQIDPIIISLRMGLAAYGMRDWNVAKEHFEMLNCKFPDNPDAKKELKKALDRIQEEKTGKFDFKSMYLQTKKGKLEFDVADYKGPIDILNIPGKGE